MIQLRIILFLGILTFIFIGFSSTASAAWYSSDWINRKAITIEADSVYSTETNFPILATTTDSDLASDAQDDGDDILFTGSDGTTKLNHEIESFDGATGELVSWIQMDISSTTDSTIYMYYNNAATSTEATTTGVWGDDYVGVWHMNDATNASTTDSTAGGYDGTVTSNPTSTPGQIANSMGFDDDLDVITTELDSFGGGDFTWSAWLTTYITTTGHKFWFWQEATSDGVEIGHDSSYDMWWATPSDWDVNYTGDTMTSDWQLVHFVSNAAGTWIYYNGVETASSANGGPYTGVGGLFIGQRPSLSTSNWGGKIDETRVASTALSPQWIQTEYENQRAVAQLISFAAEETTTDFNDFATGNWNSGATWGNAGDDVEGSGYPGASDTVTIDSHAVTMTADHSSSDFTLSGGTLTMDSYTLTLARDFTESSGTFNEGTGTVAFTSGNATVDVNSSLTLYNVTVNKINDYNYLGITSGDTLVVNGVTTLTNGNLNTGTLNAKGSISVATTFDGGTATLLIDGAGDQSFTVPDGTALPAITLNQAATTIDFDANADVTFDSDFTLQAGVFTASNGTLTLLNGDFDTSAGGTFDHNDGTIAFTGGNSTADVNSSLTFNNVTINKTNDYNILAIASGDTLVIVGTTILTNSTITVGTLEVQGEVTIASTWDGGNSPITLSGSSTQTLTGSAAAPTSGTVSISNGATVALGANTTITTLTIDSGGTLDLAGYNLTETTFTNNGTLQLEGGETVNEPDTHGASSIVEYNDTTTGRTLKNWTYTGLTCSATGQTVSMGNTETLSGNLVVSSGTFDTADQTLSINGNTTISGGTLMTGTGVLTFGDAGGDSVTISSGTLEIESDATDTDITINAGTWDNSGGTISYTGSTVTTDILSSLSTYNNLTINSTGSTYTQDGAIDIDGNFTLTAGTLDTDITNNYDITLAGDWNNSGTFIPRTSTTTLDGTVQSLTGTTSFYNLKKIVTASSTLSFGAGETTTITNDIWLTGTNGNLLVLNSTEDSTEWLFDPQGTRTISYIDVKDSNNENTTAIDCIGQNCTNAGNNTNWTFVAPTPATPTIGGSGPSSSAVIFVNGKPTTKYKTGTLVKYPEDPKVYLVNGNILQYIPDEKTFNSLGYLWTDIIEILNTDIIVKGDPLGQVNPQSPITSNPKTDKLIKYPNSPKVYLLKNSIKYWIVSEDVFITQGYNWDNIELLLENKQYPTGFSIFE